MGMICTIVCILGLIVGSIAIVSRIEIKILNKEVKQLEQLVIMYEDTFDLAMDNYNHLMKDCGLDD